MFKRCDNLKNYFNLMRVKHYIKNFLIFLPLFFNGGIFTYKIINCILGFISFCFLSSIIYVINDINDIEEDKKHPIKKSRPLASGDITLNKAKILILILILIIFLIQIICFKYFMISVSSCYYLVIYFVVNLAYSLGLKNIPIVDLLLLASGFLIRVLYGGAVVDIPISNWLFLTVLSLSFYLGLGKRRNELNKNSDQSRKSLAKYNINFLDKCLYMFLSLTLVFYSLWTVGGYDYVNQTPMIYTILVVFFIVMKYSLIIEGDNFGDPVDVVLSDKILVLSIILYILMLGGIIYVF